MTELALIEYQSDGTVKVIETYGEFTQAQYHADMARLLEAKTDWDTLCDLVVGAAEGTGVLTAEGMHNPGFTAGDFTRFLQNLIILIEKSPDPVWRDGILAKFLKGLVGKSLKTMLSTVSSFSGRGVPILFNTVKPPYPANAIILDQALIQANFGSITAMFMRQLWSDPQRRQKLWALREYFVTERLLNESNGV